MPRLLDRVRAACRVRHYSVRAEDAYAAWVRRYVLFHNKRRPAGMGAAEVGAFLTDLAVARRVAASTQNQALAALLFLYRDVPGVDLPRVDALRAERPARLPVVPGVAEVRAALDGMRGTPRLPAGLLYGSGLRLLEACRLRVKDLDFDRRQIVVRDAKGAQDRVVPLRAGTPGATRAGPAAAGPGWQYPFPSAWLGRDPAAPPGG